jgi:tmRNA-binding protein
LIIKVKKKRKSLSSSDVSLFESEIEMKSDEIISLNRNRNTIEIKKYFKSEMKAKSKLILKKRNELNEILL